MNYKFSLLDSGSGRSRAHWILSPPVTVGRCPSCDIIINDPSISRRHCQFTLGGEGELLVRDLGAKNGVYLDERKVEKAIVRTGQVVQIGSVALRTEWTDEATTQSGQAERVIDLGETQAVRVVDPDVIQLD